MRLEREEMEVKAPVAVMVVMAELGLPVFLIKCTLLALVQVLLLYPYPTQLP